MSMHRLTLVALLAVSTAANAQTADKPSDCSKIQSRAERGECADAHMQVRTIRLTNVANQNDANEVLIAVRNSFDPSLKLYLLPSQNELVVGTYPEEFARIEALVRTLDQPHKTYRVTYTITEVDAGKTVGTEHLSLVAVDGQRTTIKQGDKVPVATGSFTTENSSSQTQFTYLDVGMNVDATLNSYDNGALLKTKVEQSSIGQTNTIAGVAEPVVRQSVIEGLSFLTPGKPVMLGSIDVPNSTRRLDIAVMMEQLK